MNAQTMRNAAYEPEYLKQREYLESLLFQEKNLEDETDNIVSPEIFVHIKSYSAQREEIFYSGAEYFIKINGKEVYTAKCVNDDCAFFKLIKHRNGNYYLIFRKDLYGYSLLEIETLKTFDYYPACSLGFITDENFFEETFIWTDVIYNSSNNLMAVYGCIWACPFELALVDFSDPFRSAENQFFIYSKKNTGDIKNYTWQKNTLVVNSIHRKWIKGRKPKKGQAYDGFYIEENSIKTKKTHRFSEALCRKWLSDHQ